MATALPQRQASIADQTKQDFKAYWDNAEKSRLDNPAAQRTLIASAHKYAVCFSYLSRAMTAPPVELEPHQRIFFQELTSDAVHLVHALTGGDARGARFYLRSVIENFWRHHYFRDHVVEYGWLHTRDKYHHEMKQLREHCSWLTCFQGELQPLMTNLPRLYAELSAAVHSTSSRTLVLRQTLDDIRLLDVQVSEITKDLLGTLKVCLALCIFSEREIYLGLGTKVQEFLMNSLSVAQKRLVQKAFLKAEAEAEAAAAKAA
ncbi:hypothetical protein QTI24_01415 [Variovorax sp. J22P240]|uniref:hypothetical protein n=1 Tax=Variovorax sp. J22P240 TaxID=3053514 RepID=UPI0025776AC8|nr:hypothetical protein [Variovorax sp. J22P240]MDL9997240.1 hypothetical protein [Variovorax sp. J22P240]